MPRRYQYAFDLAGNRTQETVTIAGTPTQTNYTYDAANRITSGGVTYDNAGRMTNDGTNAYTWDRANRLLSMGGVANLYNGAGQRVQQTVGAQVTQYLLDVQPGLWQVWASTTAGNTTRQVFGPLGVQSIQQPGGAWQHVIPDALGSVRGVVDTNNALLDARLYSPYGVPYGGTGTPQTNFGFTGEPTEGTGLVDLRNRHYNPGLGGFLNLDPIEVLNRYRYVESNPVNLVDPRGLDGESAVACAAAIASPFDGPFLDLITCSKFVLEIGLALYRVVKPATAVVIAGDPGMGRELRPGGNGNLDPQWSEELERALQKALESGSDIVRVAEVLRDVLEESRRLTRRLKTRTEEEEHRNCLNRCNTSYDATSTEQFATGPKVGSKENDMLCNLVCYNGSHPVGRYLQLLGHDVRFTLLDRRPGNRQGGAFLAPYLTREALIPPDTGPDRHRRGIFGTDADMRDYAPADKNGGQMLVRQPATGTRFFLVSYTRAYALAALEPVMDF